MDDQFPLTNLFTTDCSLNSNDDYDNTLTVNSSLSVVAGNIDLLLQILLCLPAKSVIAFKLVSKQWFSLISDSSFLRKHAIRSCSRPISGLFLQGSLPIHSRREELLSFNEPRINDNPVRSKPQFLVLDESNINDYSKPLNSLNNISTNINILQSCNGLVLCRSGGLTYHVCNPTTGHQKTLHPPPSFNLHWSPYRDDNFSLAFNPMKSCYYEVIYLQVTSIIKGMYRYHIEIYSSETDSWRVFGEHMLEFSCSLISPGVFWNGSLHWKPSYYVSQSQFVYLDLSQRLLKTMPTPPFHEGKHVIEYIDECNGHLYLIKECYGREFDILEMEIDYSGWSKRYHVNLDVIPVELLAIDDENLFDVNVLLVEENEQDALKLVLVIPYNYVSYDLKEQSFQQIVYDVRPTNAFPICIGLCMGDRIDGHQFIDSLASV